MYKSTVPNTNNTILIQMVIRLKITSIININNVAACNDILIQKSIGDRFANI